MDHQILELATKLQNVIDPASRLECLDQLMSTCATLKQQITGNEDPQNSNPQRDAVSRVPTAPSNLRAVVQKDRMNELPNEILLSILETERWKVLVDSSPRLWSRIHLCPNSSIDNIISCTNVAKVSITKSQNAPLDIILDLSNLWDPTIEPQNAVRPYLFDEEGDYGYDDLMERLGDRSEESLHSQISDLVGAIVGSDEDSGNPLYHVKRWEYFQLHFSSWMRDGLVSTILMRFCAQTPILKTLTITQGWVSSIDQSEVLKKALYGSFPSTPKLTKFSTDMAIDPVGYLAGHESVRSIGFHVTPATFDYLPRCWNIHTLHLNPGWRASVFQSSILLPNLTTLMLAGYKSNTLLPLIEAPNLQRLRISGAATRDCPDSKLFAQIKVLEWDICLGPTDFDQNRKNLSQVFEQCRQLVEFITLKISENETHGLAMVEGVLKEHPMPSLQSITFLRLIRYNGDFDSSPIQSVLKGPFP
ncbi:hypothetical protein FRC17_009746 [Serendipita sp. 399]|nr:hypothetical protein FRC17_009746 [Serendipita sp. 399]